ncbi:MAG: hypothetical protein ACRC6O_10525 [Flavobacterium sp.]
METNFNKRKSISFGAPIKVKIFLIHDQTRQEITSFARFRLGEASSGKLQTKKNFVGNTKKAMN